MVDTIVSKNIKLSIFKITIIEDDCDDSDFLSEAFNEVSPKHTVLCFQSAEKLFNYLNSLADNDLPCLIVTDLNIPIINGIAILNMLNENPRYADIPKVVYSHSSNPRDKEDSIAAGALIYIKKPNTIVEIQKNAREMLSYCK